MRGPCRYQKGPLPRSMSLLILVTPEAERAFAALPPKRAREARQSLLQRLEEVAGLAALRRFGDEGEGELLRLRMGSFEAHYTLDRAACTFTVPAVVRLPSARTPSVR